MAFFFLKNYENCAAAEASPSDTVCDTRELHHFSQLAAQLKHFSSKTIRLLGSSPLNKILLAHPRKLSLQTFCCNKVDLIFASSKNGPQKLKPQSTSALKSGAALYC